MSKNEDNGVFQDNHEEYQYIDLINKIIQKGNVREDRTGVGTKSIFGAQIRFNLRDSFPLLTTKKVFWKAIVLELLWMISGSTDTTLLSNQGVHIWDKNSTRSFLDQYGFTDRKVGDIGPGYGFQWRHFGAKYIDKDTDYTHQGVDQLQNVINTIRTNPNNRRIIMCAWNVSDICQMALPPCHLLCQFYVANGELSCQMYQRSADLGLGVPFNIASYSLLTYMIAHVCNLKVGDFIHTFGDAHVYLNHADVLKQQVQRKPFPFPTLKIKRTVASIDDFRFEDFEILNYQHHAPVKMDMAI